MRTHTLDHPLSTPCHRVCVGTIPEPTMSSWTNPMDVALGVAVLVACGTVAALALIAMQAFLEHHRAAVRMRATQASLEMVTRLVHTGLQTVLTEARRTQERREAQERREVRVQWAGLAHAQRAPWEQQEPPPHPVRVVPNPRFEIPEIPEERHRGIGEARGMFHAPMPQRQRRGSDASDASDGSDVYGANHSQASVTTSEALADTEPSDDAIHAVPAAASCMCSGP